MKKTECGTVREEHPKPSEVVIRGGAVMLYAHHAKPLGYIRPDDRSDNDSSSEDDENPRRPPR